jgi:hypothetical protein
MIQVSKVGEYPKLVLRFSKGKASVSVGMSLIDLLFGG